MRQILACSVLLAAGLGCSTDPSVPVSLSGTAVRSCGPTDGPAVAVDLRGDSPATIKLFIYRSRSELPTRAWGVAPNAVDGFALLCPDGGNCQGALAGQVRFDQAGTELRGRVSISFPGITIAGPFRATWREVNILCG